MNRAFVFLSLLVCTSLLCGQIQQAPTYSKVSLVNNPFIVEPGNFKVIAFRIPETCSNAKVDGKFTASGGPKNDVEVYILDEDSMVNFKNRNHATAIYNSGRVTQATLNTPLPSGATYYLVFNNRFSIVSNKALTANIDYDCSK